MEQDNILELMDKVPETDMVMDCTGDVPELVVTREGVTNGRAEE